MGMGTQGTTALASSLFLGATVVAAGSSETIATAIVVFRLVIFWFCVEVGNDIRQLELLTMPSLAGAKGRRGGCGCCCHDEDVGFNPITQSNLQPAADSITKIPGVWPHREGKHETNESRSYCCS